MKTTSEGRTQRGLFAGRGPGEVAERRDLFEGISRTKQVSVDMAEAGGGKGMVGG